VFNTYLIDLVAFFVLLFTVFNGGRDCV